jgi:hypothetical protein
MKLTISILGIVICLFTSCQSNITQTVLITVPHDKYGHFMILFGQKKYPPLLKNNGSYLVPITGDTLRTSTSMRQFRKVVFLLVRLNDKNKPILDKNINFANISNFYTAKNSSTLANKFKGQEFYLIYFYPNFRISSSDSLKYAIKVIGGDTSLVSSNPAFELK